MWSGSQLFGVAAKHPPLKTCSLTFCAALLVLEAIVGLWGFALHTMGNLRGPSVHPFDNFIYSAPPMVPLLFPNLMILGIIGLWQLRNNQGYLRST